MGPKLSDQCVAAVIARLLRVRGVRRVFGLCGGHIMPIWMCLDAEGVAIIDVRDERAAVHMAQGHAEVTGELGVAVVTAGPGVTNAMTGIANAHVSRAPVLVLAGTAPRPQENRGALQDLAHPQLLAVITRYARTVREPALVLQELDEAITRACGEAGDPGPAFLDFPTDTLRAEIPTALQRDEYFASKPRPVLAPDPMAIEAAVDLLWSAKRPLVISGRGARAARSDLVPLLDRLNAAYLDTGESRGLVPDDHPSVVASLRGQVIREADVVVTIGRRLDFQLGYGSPAIFGATKFLRIADVAGELRDNRRGTVEIFADPGPALAVMLEAAGNRAPATDRAWIAKLQAEHAARTAKLKRASRAAPTGSDGRLHPQRLLAAIQDKLGGNAIVVVDGGDFLSFARVGLSAPTMLDPGPFGCIGVGVPYGIAAALACPDRPVLVASGDGAFGFNAMEIDTAARHNAPVVFVVANNGAWQIEVHDQTVSYGKVSGTRLQFADHAAMARAFGLYAERIETADALAGALDRAFAHPPALLDVIVTPEAVSSDAKSGLAWVPDLQPLAAWDGAERSWRHSADAGGESRMRTVSE